MHESLAGKLVKFAGMTRNLRGSGLEGGASTRLLVHAGKLMSSGIEPRHACRAACAEAITDDPEILNHYGFYSLQLAANQTREKFCMTRCEYVPVRSTATSMLPTVIKNFSLIRLNTPSACGGVVYCS